MASASIPGVFPPTEVDSESRATLVDGGVYSYLEMDESIMKCRERGFEDEDIIVDAILCFDDIIEIEPWTLRESKFKSAYAIHNRRMEISNLYFYYEEIIRVVRQFPNVNFRHLVTPQTALITGINKQVPIWDGLDKVEFLITQGKKDGTNYFEYYNKQQDN